VCVCARARACVCVGYLSGRDYVMECKEEIETTCTVQQWRFHSWFKKNEYYFNRKRQNYETDDTL